MREWLFGEEKKKEEQKSYAMSYTTNSKGPYGDPVQVAVAHKSFTEKQKQQYLDLEAEKEKQRKFIEEYKEAIKLPENRNQIEGSVKQIGDAERKLAELQKQQDDLSNSVRKPAEAAKRNASNLMGRFGVFNTGPHADMKDGKQREVNLDENALAKTALKAEEAQEQRPSIALRR